MTVLRSTTFQLHVKNEDGVAKMRTFTRMLGDADGTLQKLNDSLGDNATITIKSAESVDNITQNLRQQITQIEKANKAFERQKADLQQLIDVTGKTGVEQAVLNAQYRLGSNATEEQREEIAQLARQYYALNEAQNTTGGSMRNLRGVAQNFGWQMQDTIVQLQMGTDWMIVMSQQGSQMAAAFGATGAIVGAVIALVGASLPTIIQLLGETSSSTKELEAAQKSLDEIFDTSSFTIKGYTDDLRQLYEVDQQFAELKILAATFEAQKIIKSSRDEVVKLTNDLRGLGKGFRFTNSLQEEYDEDLTALATKLGLTTEETKKLTQAAITLGRGGSLSGFSDAVKQIATDNPKATESFTKLALKVAQAAIGSKLAENQLERLNTVLKDGTGIANDYNEEVANVIASFNNKLRGLDISSLTGMTSDELDKLDSRMERSQALFEARAKAGLQISGEELIALEKSINAYYDRKDALDAAEEAAKKREKADKKEKTELEKLEKALDQVINKTGDWNKFTNQYVDGIDTIDKALKAGLIGSVEEATELSDELFEEFFNNIEYMFEDNIIDNDFVDNFQGLVSALENQDPTNILAYADALKGQIGTLGQMSSMMSNTVDLITSGTAEVEAAIEDMNSYQKAMFFITRSIAAAEALINGITLGSKLAAMFPMAAPAMIATGATIGGLQAGAIMGTTFAGFFDEGGYIPSGQTGIVSEYRDELVNGVLVKGPASVTGGDETSRIMNSNESMSRTKLEVNLVNNAPGVDHEVRQIDENTVEIIAKKVFNENIDKGVSGVMSRKGTRTNKTLTSKYSTTNKY